MTEQNYPPPGDQPQYGAPQYGQPVYNSDQNQPGYYAPAAVTRPPAMDKAVLLMKIGAGVAIVTALVDIALQSDIDKSMQQLLINLGVPADQANQSGGSSIGSTLFSTLVAVALWWWMSMKNGEGKSWARILSTVFFGIFTLGTLANVLTPMPALVKLVAVIYWAVAVAATWFMWQKESSNFYEAASRRP